MINNYELYKVLLGCQNGEFDTGCQSPVHYPTKRQPRHQTAGRQLWSRFVLSEFQRRCFNTRRCYPLFLYRAVSKFHFESRRKMAALKIWTAASCGSAEAILSSNIIYCPTWKNFIRNTLASSST